MKQHNLITSLHVCGFSIEVIQNFKNLMHNTLHSLTGITCCATNFKIVNSEENKKNIP